MNKRIFPMLLLFTLLFLASCDPFAEEQLAADVELSADEVFPNESDVSDALHSLVFLPKDADCLFSCRKDNEVIADYKADISARIAYEQELNARWYKQLPARHAQNDRISTWLHPDGWRVAIYDNRRNRALREAYGSDAYVFSVRIKKIEYDPSVFPKYPEADKHLVLDEALLGAFDTYPAERLPENFPGLPAHAVFLRAKCLPKGLVLTALTTYADLDAYLKSIAETYAPAGACYADETGNYFYLEVYSVQVYSEDSADVSLPEPPKDPALLELYEENRMHYTREELPHFKDEDVFDTAFCKITIQVIRAEWVPAWYPRS